MDDKIGDISLLHVLQINLIYLSNIKSINQATFTTTTYHINNMWWQYCKMDINVVMSLTSERKMKAALIIIYPTTDKTNKPMNKT